MQNQAGDLGKAAAMTIGSAIASGALQGRQIAQIKADAVATHAALQEWFAAYREQEATIARLEGEQDEDRQHITNLEDEIDRLRAELATARI